MPRLGRFTVVVRAWSVLVHFRRIRAMPVVIWRKRGGVLVGRPSDERVALQSPSRHRQVRFLKSYPCACASRPW